jgi:hypothetical protein
MELLDNHPWLPVVAALLVMSVFVAAVRRVLTVIIVIALLLVIGSALLHPMPLVPCPVATHPIRT